MVDEEFGIQQYEAYGAAIERRQATIEKDCNHWKLTKRLVMLHLDNFLFRFLQSFPSFAILFTLASLASCSPTTYHRATF